jgi:hypothetical protein
MNYDEWGFCPHQDNGLCEDCTANPSQRSFHQSELTRLTHDIQVEIFGWCGCEDSNKQYNDCPMEATA